MRDLDRLYKTAKKLYDEGGTPLNEISAMVRHVIELLDGPDRFRLPNESAGGKQYWILKEGSRLSRPFLPGCWWRQRQ